MSGHFSLKPLFAILAFFLLAGCQQTLTSYVNPFVGTDGHGHTFPGAIVPFGMIQPGPDTRQEGWDGCSGYHYSDDTIYGFSHTHLSGTGCEDFGDLLIMPFSDGCQFNGDVIHHSDYQSHFSHSNEIAHPGYYCVVLDRDKIEVELTCSERVAYHRYTFLKSGKQGMIIDLHHRDQLIEGFIQHTSNGVSENSGIITGYRRSSAWNSDQKLFFAIKAPFSKIEYRNNNTQAIVHFPEDTKEVVITVAISAVDETGALRNLLSTTTESFDKACSDAQDIWEEALGKIEIEGGSRKQLTNFYTALYHCMTAPYLFSDIDGRYRGTDDNIHKTDSNRRIYTVFSLWDTYRALHPLLTIIEQERTKDFIYTFLKQFEQGGELPQWELASQETHCMIGYHAVPVILEALNADLIDSAMQKPLLDAMIATANRTESQQRYGIDGFLSSEIDNESVSKTLEYAYDDWCIAQYAQKTATQQNRHFNDSIYNLYVHRSQSYRNIMDSAGFMHPRRNGGFLSPFSPAEVNNNYTEANSWQYSSYVPHDIYGWISALGGDAKATQFLDSLFFTNSSLEGRNQADITGLIGQYAHGNEPSHHAAYLYTYLGHSEKTEQLVHQILNTFYTNAPDGLCGNEDCGQMSAWYVLSSLGFYPVCPGSNEYVTTVPLFKYATIHRDDGTHITIEKSEWADGQFWRPSLTPGALRIATEDFHPSSLCTINQAQRITPTPYFSNWQQQFKGSDTIRLNNHDGNNIFYTLDGSTPTILSHQYLKPIVINHDGILKAVAYDPQTGYSAIVSQNKTLFHADKTVSYLTKPDPQYYDNGEEGLVDRVLAPLNYRIGGWQGWTGDMQVLVDLQTSRPIKTIGIDCLEQMRSWIFFPKQISVEYSADGTHFQPFGTYTNREFPADKSRQGESNRQLFKVTGNANARILKITVSNYGKMPSWHTSAGEQAWLFIDEISVEP